MPNFLSSTSLLYKICQQIWGCVNQHFYTFYTSHLRRNSTRGAVFIIQTSDHRCSISQFSKTNCTQSIFRTINRGFLAKPFKKFPKSPIRPPGSHNFWQAPNLQCELWSIVWMNINRVTLQHNKEFIMFIFLFNGFITMYNLKKSV